MMTSAAFDSVLAGILIFSLFIGLYRGFLRELVSLLVWFGGLFAVFYFSGNIAAYLKPWFGASLLRYGVAFCFLFFTLLCVSFLCNLAVACFFDKVGVLFLDKFLGLLFGIIRAASINVSVLLVLSMTSIKQNAFYTESQLVPYFLPIVMWVKEQLPNKTDQLQTWINEKLEDKGAFLEQQKNLEQQK